MSAETTVVDNGEALAEVTFRSTLDEIEAIQAQIEMADEALQELEEHAEEAQEVVRSAALRTLIRRLVEVRTILASVLDGVTEASESVEALEEIYGGEGENGEDEPEEDDEVES